jgi:all-trans-retinol 13,14-reductase
VPTLDRFRTFDPAQRFDAIVIGSGLGGLTTAAMLSKHGKKVLVIDQHTVAGGNATIFKRKGYVFEVGVHYIGACGPDGLLKRVLRDAGVDVEFLPMDAAGFDTLVFPDGFRFAYPKGIEAFEARLLETFPQEARGIRRWTRFLRQSWKLIQADNRPLHILAAIPFSLHAVWHLNSTLDRVLDGCTQDPRLRAVLIGAHLDHGVAPSQVAAMVHAGLVMHYVSEGGFYPRGGGQAMSDALVARIESAGGKVLLLATAEKIEIENGRATGVTFFNKHVGRHTVRAPVVVSNADLKQTFSRLLPKGSMPASLVEKVNGYQMAGALVALYLGVKKEALGEAAEHNTNYWVFPSNDVEREYQDASGGRFSESSTIGITITTNKDPAQTIAPPGIVNLQLMALAPSDRALWGATAEGQYRKEPQYQAAKKAFRDRLVRQASAVFPNLESGIVYEELATPLTHARYTLSSGGTGYGIALIPSQFNGARPGVVTPVSGLLLAGASTRNGHGVWGAVLSGRDAAKAALKLLR